MRLLNADPACPFCQSWYVPAPPQERCPSGRRCQTRNLVRLHGLRGFESHPLRKLISKTTDLSLRFTPQANDGPLGEVSEWPKVQHWKCCVVHATAGSNPALSADPPTLSRWALVPRATVFSPTPSEPEGSSGNEKLGVRGTFFGSAQTASESDSSPAPAVELRPHHQPK